MGGDVLLGKGQVAVEAASDRDVQLLRPADQARQLLDPRSDASFEVVEERPKLGDAHELKAGQGRPPAPIAAVMGRRATSTSTSKNQLCSFWTPEAV
jgi:hypothetical protein